MGVTEIRFNWLVAGFSSLAIARDSWKILGAAETFKKERRDTGMSRRPSVRRALIHFGGNRLFGSFIP
jgi:hypothetical protein